MARPKAKKAKAVKKPYELSLASRKLIEKMHDFVVKQVTAFDKKMKKA